MSTVLGGPDELLFVACKCHRMVCTGAGNRQCKRQAEELEKEAIPLLTIALATHSDIPLLHCQITHVLRLVVQKLASALMNMWQLPNQRFLASFFHASASFCIAETVH